MELREFVSSALIQILGGVQDAQKAAAEHGGQVNPAFSGTLGSRGLVKGRGNFLMQEVEFDVAVTVSEQSGEKVGGGLRVVFGFGAKLEGQESSSQVSRIKFTVPLGLPEG